MKSFGRKGNVKGTRIIKEETRFPLAMIFILDKSGSMVMGTPVIDEKGNENYVAKIEQLKYGFTKSVESLCEFKKNNVKFDLKYQVITLDSYGKAMFDGYKAVDDPQYDLSEVKFEADGVTNVEASFNTLVKYLTRKELGHYNRAVNVIMLSDGVPTDVNGNPLTEKEWKRVVDMLNDYLEKKDIARNVTFHYIAVGEQAKNFGLYLAGEGHFHEVKDCENLGDMLDQVTRQSFIDATTVTGDAIGYGKSFDEDEEDEPSADDEEDCGVSKEEDEPDVGISEPMDEDHSTVSGGDGNNDDGDDGEDDGSLDKILDF